MRNWFSRSVPSAEVETHAPGLLIHIKRSAGTSLLNSLETQGQVLYDYGESDPRTSPVVKKLMYDRFDPYNLKQELAGTRTWLAGHFSLDRYASFVDCRRIVTVLRDPVERVVSRYNQIRANVSPELELSDFVENRKSWNEQYRLLKDIPINCIGYVGIMEKLAETLEIVNAGLHLDLSEQHARQSEQQAITTEALSDEVRTAIETHNEKDIALYNRALAQHTLRLTMLRERKSWCHGYHMLSPEGLLTGAAFYADSDRPVKLSVRRDGQELTSIEATRFHRREIKSSLPRDRFVGFETQLPPPFDNIEVIVADTLQALEERPADTRG